MSVLRSRKVKQYGCLVATQTAFETISLLLESGEVEIFTRDLENSDSPFIKILLRIRTLRGRLRSYLTMLQRRQLEPIKRLSSEQTKQYISRRLDHIQKQHQDFLLYLDQFEDKCQKEMDDTNEILENNKTLKQQLQLAEEQLQAAKLKLGILGDHDQVSHIPGHMNLQMVSGSCSKLFQHRLQKMVFRISRGNSFSYFKTVHDSHGEVQQKVLFIIFISGEQNSYVYNRIMKLLKTLDCTLFELPEHEDEIRQHMKLIQKNVRETKPLVELSETRLKQQIDTYIYPKNSPRIMQFLTEALYFERIAYILTHQQDIISGNHLIIKFYKAEGSKALPHSLPIFEPHSSLEQKTEMPRIQSLAQVNQLVQMFAIPKHNQIIPSIFMLSTVPILFGMMFSDFGHGLILLSTAFILNMSPFWKLMGVMSIYFGVLFNEFLGMKVDWFYQASKQSFGISPLWGRAENALAFENSLKMKLSMIAAFVHMLFGSVIRIVNDIHQKKRATLFIQSIPKLILLVCTVGYLVFLIIYKWLIDWTGRQSQAPSIISMYLDMYLGYKDRKTSMYPSIQTEKLISTILKGISILCLVSIMIGTEIHKRYFGHHTTTDIDGEYKQLQQESDEQQKKRSEIYQRRLSDQQQSQRQNKKQGSEHRQIQYQRKISKTKGSLHSSPKKAEEQQHLFGPLQGFQYVLSLISSTTSYLRLFALSLAHQKLSVLLLNFMLSSVSSQTPSVFWLSFKSLVFFFITVGMMLLLDVLQCMMHVIRLHWVQWMGRFYKGGGVLFKPQENTLIQ